MAYLDSFYDYRIKEELESASQRHLASFEFHYSTLLKNHHSQDEAWSAAKKRFNDDILNDLSMVFETDAFGKETKTRISERIAHPEFCGYPQKVDYEKNGLSAGAIFAIYYNACAGVIARPDKCDKLDQTQEMLLERYVQAILESKNNKNKKRRGWNWSLASFLIWFPMLFLHIGITVCSELPISVICSFTAFVFHCIFFMRKYRLSQRITIIFSIINLILLTASIASIPLGFWRDEPWLYLVGVLLLAITPIYTYVIHLCHKSCCGYCNIPTVTDARFSLLKREKAYAQLDKFHDYLLRGTITQREYDIVRAETIASLKEHDVILNPANPH